MKLARLWLPLPACAAAYGCLVFGSVLTGPVGARPGVPTPTPHVVPTPISGPVAAKRVGLSPGVSLLKSYETLKIGGWRAVWEFQGARLALQTVVGPGLTQDIDVGSLNKRGCSTSVLVLANCRNLSPATIQSLRRYIKEGGRVLATYQSTYRQADNSSWSPNGLALGPELGVRFSRWSGGSTECGRLIPASGRQVELLRHQAMLVDLLPGAKVLANWDRPERSPAIVQGPSGIYCGEDLLAPENSQSPAVLEILANCLQALDKRLATNRPFRVLQPKPPNPPFAKLPDLEDQQQIAVGVGTFDLQGGSIRIRAHQGPLQLSSLSAKPTKGSGDRTVKGSYPEVWVRQVDGRLKLSVASSTGPVKELAAGESSFELSPKKSQDYLDVVWECTDHTARWSAMRGKLEIRLPLALPTIRSSRGLELVNQLPLDAYIMGVVPSEVPASFPAESLKAMAVVARSYCLSHLDRHHQDGFDVCSEVHCQVYRGLAQESAQTNLAVYSTLGEVLTYQGRPADTTFHACCGGYGVDVEAVWPKGKAVGYLRGRPDSEPIFQSDLGNTKELKNWLQQTDSSFCSAAGRYRWTESMTWNDLERKLQQSLPVLLGSEFKGLKKLTNLEVEVRDVSGRVTQMLIEGEAEGESYRLGGDAVRWITSGGRIGSGGLNSSLFVFDIVGTGDSRKVLFQGAGWGHGVGLCQEGAAGRAKAGHSYLDILTHYYRGTEVLPSVTKKK